jgi:hypothetical protein
VADSTIPAPATGGGGTFSLSFRTPGKGLAVGGDLDAQDNGVDMAAYSNNRGKSWTNGGDLGGYRSGVDWLNRSRATAVAVGPTGSDVTYDGGRHWTTFDDVAYDAVQCTRDGACWTSGPAGRVSKLVR